MTLSGIGGTNLPLADAFHLITCPGAKMKGTWKVPQMPSFDLHWWNESFSPLKWGVFRWLCRAHFGSFINGALTIGIVRDDTTFSHFFDLLHTEQNSYHCIIIPQITQINAEITMPAAWWDNTSAKIPRTSFEDKSARSMGRIVIRF